MLLFNTKQHGFIALISVLMLSVVLLAAVISLAQYSMISRYALLTLEQKEVSVSLAQACVQVARIAIVNDPLYQTQNHVVPLGNARCFIDHIFPQTPSSAKSRVETTASSSGATTNLRVEINTSSGAVTKMEEIPNF